MLEMSACEVDLSKGELEAGARTEKVWPGPGLWGKILSGLARLGRKRKRLTRQRRDLPVLWLPKLPR
jgi:hypothetical protein